MYASVTVPPPPYQQAPEIIYIYAGLQSSTNPSCGIVQPVLQWGPTPAGGGYYWSIASWYWTQNFPYHGPFFQVATNDVLDMNVTLMKNTTTYWDVRISDRASYLSSDIQPDVECVFDEALPAVFEYDGSAPLTNCNEVPAGSVINFSGVGLWTATLPANFYTFQPYAAVPEFPMGFSQPPQCGWGISNGVSNGFGYPTLIVSQGED
jgi:hypothetical protein